MAPLGAPGGGAPRRRLRALRLAAVLLPLAGLLAIAWQSWGAVEREAEARVERVAQMLLEHARGAFQTQEMAIAALELHISGLDWPAIAASREVTGFLAGLHRLTPGDSGLALLPPEALPYAAFGGMAALPPDPPAQGAALLAGRPFVGAPAAAQPQGEVQFPLVRLRRRADGTTDGALVAATLSPVSFEAFYRTVREHPRDALALLRLDGAVLASVPAAPSRPGARLPDTATPVLQALAEERLPPSRVALAPDGAPRLTAVRRLPDLEVAVAYGLAPEALRIAWQDRMRGPFFGALAAMALLGALTLRAERAMRDSAAAEARSRRAERQATLGLLAGGLTHDFGNITQSVLAAAHLLRRHAADPARVRDLAEHLAGHAQRAASLARRLLDASRRGGLPHAAPRGVVPVSEALCDLVALLDATLGAGIRVRLETSPGLLGTGFDRAEFETALINLAANARDAMPQGGTVRIGAISVDLDPGAARALALVPRSYLRVTVADSGSGMDPETLRRFGEAFYSTKPEGKGTGLGVAMVAAFTRAAGGALRAESSPGRGSTITLWVPAA